MSQYLVMIVNKTNARFLTLRDPPPLEYSGPHLVEQQALLNPIQNQAGRELWTSSKSGGNRGATRQSHGYDDHRQRHLKEFDRRFAHAINAGMSHFMHTYPIQHILLVAEPQILGHLRPMLMATLPKAIIPTEVAKDLCNLSVSEIYQYLLDQQLLPRLAKQVR